MRAQIPDNDRMLPQLPTLPDIPESIPSLPNALSEGWTWIAVGAVLAVVALWALRRTKRMVVATAMAAAGLVAAWNAGLLPLVS